MSAPVRIQLSRRKGWRMPPNTVKVDRSTRWGNHIRVGEERGIGYRPWTAESSVEQYREDTLALTDPDRPDGSEPLDLSPLRGKNLACWCGLDQPCHADVLLELANRERPEKPNLSGGADVLSEVSPSTEQGDTQWTTAKSAPEPIGLDASGGA